MSAKLLVVSLGSLSKHKFWDSGTQPPGKKSWSNVLYPCAWG